MKKHLISSGMLLLYMRSKINCRLLASVGIDHLRREENRSIELALTPVPLLHVACWMVLQMFPGSE